MIMVFLLGEWVKIKNQDTLWLKNYWRGELNGLYKDYISNGRHELLRVGNYCFGKKCGKWHYYINNRLIIKGMFSGDYLTTCDNLTDSANLLDTLIYIFKNNRDTLKTYCNFKTDTSFTNSYG